MADQLKKRPRPIQEQSDINPEVMENNLTHIDKMLTLQDQRRIPVQTLLDQNETDVAVIVAAFNSFLATMNTSELTEES